MASHAVLQERILHEVDGHFGLPHIIPNIPKRNKSEMCQSDAVDPCAPSARFVEQELVCL